MPSPQQFSPGDVFETLETSQGGAVQIPVAQFLDEILPPVRHFLSPSRIVDALLHWSDDFAKQKPITAKGRWRGFTDNPAESSYPERDSFHHLGHIVRAVFKAGGSKQTNVTSYLNPARVMSGRRQVGYLPDTYLSTGRGTRWTDMVALGELKKYDEAEDVQENIKKVTKSIARCFHQDPRRRFIYAFTIENATMRFWFCDRTQIVVSEPFNFITEHEPVVHFVLSLMYAEPADYGLDPTMRLLDDGRRYDITVHSTIGPPRIYRTIDLLYISDHYTIHGKGTRVWKVIEVKDGHEVGVPVVLKDSWVDPDRRAEGTIIEDVRSRSSSSDGTLDPPCPTVECHGDVYLDNEGRKILDCTRRSGEDGLFTSVAVGSRGQIGCTAGESEAAAAGHLVHYRIVFREICRPLEDETSLSTVFRALSRASLALRDIHGAGWVHRDISTGNILLTETGNTLLGDFQSAKKMGEGDECRIGTKEFMAVEIDLQMYRFRLTSPPSSPLKRRFPEKLDQFRKFEDELRAKSEARKHFRAQRDLTLLPEPKPETKHPDFRYNPLHDLESLWWIAVYFLITKEFTDNTKPTTEAQASVASDAQRQYALELFLHRNRRSTSLRDSVDFLAGMYSLPRFLVPALDFLDYLRQELCFCYTAQETDIESIDYGCANKLYQVFHDMFQDLATSNLFRRLTVRPFTLPPSLVDTDAFERNVFDSEGMYIPSPYRWRRPSSGSSCDGLPDVELMRHNRLAIPPTALHGPKRHRPYLHREAKRRKVDHSYLETPFRATPLVQAIHRPTSEVRARHKDNRMAPLTFCDDNGAAAAIPLWPLGRTTCFAYISLNSAASSSATSLPTIFAMPTPFRYDLDDQVFEYIETPQGNAVQVSLAYFLAAVLPPVQHTSTPGQVVAELLDWGYNSSKQSPITSKGRWRGFSTDPAKSSCPARDSFRHLPSIVRAIFKAGGSKQTPASFRLNPARVMDSRGRHPGYLPDAYLFTASESRWHNVVVFGELKKHDEDKDVQDNIKKVTKSMARCFHQDPRRRFIYAFTIENTSMRLWFCDRTQIVVSEPFNFIIDHGPVVHFFLSTMYADPADYGLDTTMRPLDDGLQYDIAVRSAGGHTRVYRTIESLFISNSYAIRDKGTRVWKVTEVKNGREVGGLLTLKDTWVNADRTAEGTNIEDVRSQCASGSSDILSNLSIVSVEYHGNVYFDRKGCLELDCSRSLVNHVTGGSGPATTREEPARTQSSSCTSNQIGAARLAHYRIVTKDVCKPLDEERSLAIIFRALASTCLALQNMHAAGWVHRDVSTGNILLTSVGDALLADFQYAKRMGEGDEFRAGTAEFRAVEVDSNSYKFKLDELPSAYMKERYPDMLDKFEKFEEEYRAERKARESFEFLVNFTVTTKERPPFRYNPLHDLESLWWIAVYFIVAGECIDSANPSTNPRSSDALDTQRRYAMGLFQHRRRRTNTLSCADDFLEGVQALPSFLDDVISGLEYLRRELCFCYSVREVDVESIDHNCAKGVHELFHQVFTTLAANDKIRRLTVRPFTSPVTPKDPEVFERNMFDSKGMYVPSPLRMKRPYSGSSCGDPEAENIARLGHVLPPSMLYGPKRDRPYLHRAAKRRKLHLSD
ncbi:hypothetical protein NM688_g6067 [Phlebia brevispora]|uniref:Uncharacterized protein n=1 Tax=Phlebia brevispora TaxID=194682 RepID=A0ACC1SK45_9APHY|nr:hypothetical protein NM688_g6067 [Phlebia brevispora]